MALSIKNVETERLARELAMATGETVTSAVTAALRGRLDQVAAAGNRRAATLAELRRISRDAARRWPAELRDRDHGSDLYDDQGLPR